MIVETGLLLEDGRSALATTKLPAFLDNLATSPLGITEDESFRISIAGAQEKTALLRGNGRWCKPRGTTATIHIFKPSIGKLPNGMDLTASVENEYLCLKILQDLCLPNRVNGTSRPWL